MNRKLAGKFLVRKSKLKDGRRVLVLAGMFLSDNFSLDEIDDGDEMWVANIEVKSGGIRFCGNVDGSDSVGSVEDFLEGNGVNPSDWKIESRL